MMKVAGVMQKSTQIMGIMNNLVKLPQINQVMMSMAREMEKAGLIEEVMEDVMDNDAELDEQADEELDKVVEEITLGIKTAATAHQALPQQKGEEEDDDMKGTYLFIYMVVIYYFHRFGKEIGCFERIG